MSSHYADTVVLPWIQANKWPQTETADELLVISVPVAASPGDNGPITWHSAVAGIIQVKMTHDHSTESLKDISVHIEIPGYGHAVAFSAKNVDLKKPLPIQVVFPSGSLDGHIKFSYTADKKEVQAEWVLYFPWLGTTVEDHRSLIPADRKSSFLANKLQNVKVISDLEVSALREAPQSKSKVVRDSSGRELILFDDSDEDKKEKEIAVSYIHDNVGAGNPIVTVPALSGPKSEGNTLDISFLGVFQLVGTILPEKMAVSAALYVKIPFIGRTKLIEIKGDLIGDGVTTSINLALAKGSVTLNALANSSGKHDLYMEKLKLEIKFLKTFEFNHTKLFGLPF